MSLEWRADALTPISQANDQTATQPPTIQPPGGSTTPCLFCRRLEPTGPYEGRSTVGRPEVQMTELAITSDRRQTGC